MKNLIELKKFFPAILIIGVVSLLFIILQTQPKQSAGPEKYQPEPKEERQFPATTTSALSRKEQIEQKIIETKGAGYTKFSLEEGGEKKFIVDYFPPEYFSIPKEKQHDGGIMVFEIQDDGNVEKFWESEDKISLSIPVIEVRDITGDGKIEILAGWSDGKIENLFIYSWTGNEFRYISPTTIVSSPYSNQTGIGYVFAVHRGDIQVKDLDGDNIDEVIISGGTTRDEIGNEIPIESETIYKWDTEKQEYYLWQKK